MGSDVKIKTKYFIVFIILKNHDYVKKELKSKNKIILISKAYRNKYMFTTHVHEKLNFEVYF